MSRKKITIDDLSGWAREQVERKLGIGRAGAHAQDQARQSPSQQPSSGNTIAMRSTRTPNRTESEYNLRYLGGKGAFEALTLRLPGGSRYTPDYMTVDDTGRVTLHEVKGTYRLQSHGRALTAFRECKAHFKMFNFVWATRQPNGDYVIT